MSEPVIAVTELTKEFGELTAVDGLSFSVEQGEIFGLVGPDGAGKTTTLRMLAGVLDATSGQAMVAGHDVTQDAEAAKNHLSYMPQRFGLYEDLTVNENLRFYGDIFGVRRSDREERTARLLAASGMSEFRDRLAGNLSGGMKQKLALSCALIHTPRVLLLDEPTNGVDPVSRRDFWRILYSLLSEGVTIVYSTAYLDEAERCHRLALLHEGKLLMLGSPDELKRNIPGEIVTVPSTNPRPLKALLKDAPGVSHTVLAGDRVNLLVDDAAVRIPELRRRMDAASADYSDVLVAAPTMEDLFVATVRDL